jgi:hypothetical protein
MEEEQKVTAKQIDPRVRRKRKIIAISVTCALIVVTIALAVGLRLGLRAAIYSAASNSGSSSSSSSGSSSGSGVSKPLCPSSMNLTLYNGHTCQGSALGIFSLEECMKVELVDFSIRRSDNGASWLSYSQDSSGNCGQVTSLSSTAVGQTVSYGIGGDAPQSWCMKFTSLNNSTNSISFSCQ